MYPPLPPALQKNAKQHVCYTALLPRAKTEPTALLSCLVKKRLYGDNGVHARAALGGRKRGRLSRRALLRGAGAADVERPQAEQAGGEAEDTGVGRPRRLQFRDSER